VKPTKPSCSIADRVAGPVQHVQLGQLAARPSQRPDARYCGDACRAAACRNRHNWTRRPDSISEQFRDLIGEELFGLWRSTGPGHLTSDAAEIAREISSAVEGAGILAELIDESYGLDEWNEPDDGEQLDEL
jgi:hypothetical protein